MTHQSTQILEALTQHACIPGTTLDIAAEGLGHHPTQSRQMLVERGFFLDAQQALGDGATILEQLVHVSVTDGIEAEYGSRDHQSEREQVRALIEWLTEQPARETSS